MVSVDVIEFDTVQAYSNLGLTKVKNKICKHSREEKLKAIERISPKSLIYSGNT
jgi:hypothetical protein